MEFSSEGGKEITGYDLILIDSDTMGLADSFLKRKGKLPSEKIDILNECIKELKQILPLLEGSEKSYYKLLEQLAKEILTQIKSDQVK